jgi:hypothetical protein
VQGLRVARGDHEFGGGIVRDVVPAQVPLGLGLLDGGVEVLGVGAGHGPDRLEVGPMLDPRRLSGRK